MNIFNVKNPPCQVTFIYIVLYIIDTIQSALKKLYSDAFLLSVIYKSVQSYFSSVVNIINY